jgi:hypothetical protein
MHRLEPVASVRQRAACDGGQRLLEIALLQRGTQRNILDVTTRRRGNQLFAHESWVLRRAARNKPESWPAAKPLLNAPVRVRSASGC